MCVDQRTVRTCRKKTARGNVYPRRCLAENKAREIRAVSHDPVVAYQCRSCGLWHVGKPQPRDKAFRTESS